MAGRPGRRSGIDHLGGGSRDRAHHLRRLARRHQSRPRARQPAGSVPRGVPAVRHGADAPDDGRQAPEAAQEQAGAGAGEHERADARGASVGGGRPPRRARPARATEGHGHRQGRRRGPLLQRHRRLRVLRAGQRRLPRRVPGVQQRRDRVRVGEPGSAHPRLHPPAARHRGSDEGTAAHRQRGRAGDPTPALPDRSRPRAVLGRGVRPAVVGHRGGGHSDQPTRRRALVPVRDHAARSHAGEGRVPVTPAGLHGRGHRELDRPRRARPAPTPQDRARRGGPRVDPVLHRTARQDGRAPRLGRTRHEPPRTTEPLLAQQHVRELRGGRVRDPGPPRPRRREPALGDRLPTPRQHLAALPRSDPRALRRRARGRDATHHRRQRREDLQPLTREKGRS